MLKNKYFHPKILTTFKTYGLRDFIQDTMSGIIVGIIALPLAIAFGIASGATPHQGIITAIIAGFLISLLGGSRVQIGGPTGAFIVIVYSVIQQHGYSGLLLATSLAGLILILMGIFKIGDWIKLIPSPIITGFTSGIAVVIFSSQIKDLLGLPIEKVPVEFLDKWHVYFQHYNDINFSSLILALVSIGSILSFNKISSKIPSAFLAIIITSLAVSIFKIPVDTIGSRFGVFSGVIPLPSLPVFSLELIGQVLPAAFTIAILGAIESLLSAVVSDAMIGGKHRSNTELIGQGIANIVVPLFGGIPATGAIARTATNVKNGGKTPIAGIVHSITLLIIFLFIGKFVSYIPMATLAGILILVSYNMSEWREFKSLLKAPGHDVVVLIITFILTVVFDLTLAIEVGLILSSFLFAKRISESSTVVKISKSPNDYDTYFDRPGALSSIELPEGVEIVEIEGAFFFGAASKLESMIRNLSLDKKTLVLRMNKLISLDATGIKTLMRIHKDLKKEGCQMILADCSPEIGNSIRNSELYDLLDKKDLEAPLADALKEMSI